MKCSYCFEKEALVEEGIPFLFCRDHICKTPGCPHLKRIKVFDEFWTTDLEYWLNIIGLTPADYLCSDHCTYFIRSTHDKWGMNGLCDKCLSNNSTKTILLPSNVKPIPTSNPINFIPYKKWR